MKKLIVLFALILGGISYTWAYATISSNLSAVTNDYVAVEQMPQYPGGQTKLLKFISDNLVYPESAKAEGIEGRVILRFVVKADGTVGEVQVLRSLDPACDKEAIRLIKSTPRWIPGKQSGKSVNVWFTLPVTFRLP